MTIYMTEPSRELALSERARWVGLRLDVIGESSAIRRFRVTDLMTGAALYRPRGDGVDLDLADAEEVIDLHSKPTRLGN
jgi:hypothetical protein